VLGRDAEYWFAVDTTNEGRLHIHGGLVIRPDELPLADVALRRAGGRWGNPRGHQHQTHFGFFDGDNWAKYSARHVPTIRRAFRGSAIVATHRLRRRAKQIYDELRTDVGIYGAD
jgi:hypothetical protein